MAAPTNYMIGMADITVGGDDLAHQASEAIFTAEPDIQNIDLYDAPFYDAQVNGWNVTLQVSLDDETYTAIKQSLSGVADLVDSTDQITVTGVKDGALFQQLRDTAKEIVIHPSKLDPSNTDYDITIFKAIPTSSFQRTYGKEKGSWQVTFQALHNTGDGTSAGNYFKIGDETDDSGV